MAYPDNPHFQVPVTLVDGQVRMVEQDSDEEITQCVLAVLRTPVEFRDDLPEFGTPDQLFKMAGVNPALVKAAIETWEPRATAEVQEQLADLIDHVTISLSEKANP